MPPSISFPGIPVHTRETKLSEGHGLAVCHQISRSRAYRCIHAKLDYLKAMGWLCATKYLVPGHTGAHMRSSTIWRPRVGCVPPSISFPGIPVHTCETKLSEGHGLAVCHQVSHSRAYRCIHAKLDFLKAMGWLCAVKYLVPGHTGAYMRS